MTWISTAALHLTVPAVTHQSDNSSSYDGSLSVSQSCEKEADVNIREPLSLNAGYKIVFDNISTPGICEVTIKQDPCNPLQ